MSSRDLEKASKARVEQQLAEQDALRREIMNKLEKKEASLRFDRTCVSASSLAEQYFCEKKLRCDFFTVRSIQSPNNSDLKLMINS